MQDAAFLFRLKADLDDLTLMGAKGPLPFYLFVWHML